MKEKLFTTLFALLVLFGWTAASTSSAYALPHAQIVPPEPPIVLPPPDVTIAYQRVNVTIDDQVATTHIEQLFVNENNWLLEGTYLFPLPEGAAVSQLTMWVDGMPIEAKILEKDEARAIYDQIVRQLRDPALLEYVGSSAIQANVFPIPPNSERKIEIEYTQVLPADGGLFHYVYPQSGNLYTNLPLKTQSIRVEVRSNEAMRTIYSPSHPVAIDRDGEFRATVGYEAANVMADTDFELYYSVSPEAIGLNLLSYKEAGQDGFFLLLAAPSVEVNTISAKDVILVLDTSGSMEGEKLAQAKEAALFVVDHLNPQDRFNIVSFSTGTRQYATELASASNPGGVRSFVNSLEALGGTNISQALLEAAAQADSQRPTTIIFLTDGLATEGIVDTGLLLDNVQANAPDNVRLFAFGVGDDVDTTLLDSLANNHRGTSTYVRPFQAINEIVGSFYSKISAPVLTDIQLDFGDIFVEQLYPQTLPDLFVGSQLVLVGRYRNGGPADITLSGTVNGERQTFVYRDNLFLSQGGHDFGDDFIPRLWATRAIGHLLTQIRLHGENPELVQSVVNLSVRYGIITPYTSYLIEEDDIFSQQARDVIVEEQLEEMAAEPDAFTGAAAVDEAAISGEMAEAEAPAPIATTVASDGTISNANETVRLAGSKTFVLRNNLWIDTEYEPTDHMVNKVGFASDSYFELITAVPELGQYLALGPRVLFVYNGQAYEIVDEIVNEPVILPESAPDPTRIPPTIAPDPGQPITTQPDQPTLIAASERPEPDSDLYRMPVWIVFAIIGVPALIGFGIWIGKRQAEEGNR